MSGICGIVALDGDNPTAAQIGAMTAKLERRGPDRTHKWLDQDVALGHTLLATTPEALVETLPLTDATSGCTITADVRLDNREELFAALALPSDARTIGDGELILRAYLIWGDECVAHLLGDFAFAIWDPRSTSLLCARDQMGMRQLLYHHDAARYFVFATEADAILAHPDVESPLNHQRIGDYLSNMEGADLTSTFFSTIVRLPPAHTLKLERGAIVLRRYWQLELEPELHLTSDEAYAEAFLKVFTEAVRCRLRSTGSIGAMLSGGLDSNAVVAVAVALRTKDSLGPLPTFSAVGPDASGCVETHSIMTAMMSAGVTPTAVNYAKLLPFRDDLIRETVESAEPFDGHMTLIRSVYLAAHRAGINVVLDGVMSDVMLASDFHSAILLRRGRVVQSFREIFGKHQYYGTLAPIWRGVLSTIWQAFSPLPLRKLRFLVHRHKLNNLFKQHIGTVAPTIDVNHALSRRKKIQARDANYLRIDSLTRYRGVTHPNVVVGRERYDRVAASLGIEPRDPFVDVRLIHFCLSLPLHQLERNGWPKWILRHAMSRLLPGEIIWRRGKQHLGPDFTCAILRDLEPQSNIADVRALNPTFYQRLEAIYLSNWIAYFRRKN